MKSFFIGVSPNVVALGSDRSDRLAIWLDRNEEQVMATPALAQYLFAIERVQETAGIALGYRVQSQPAFPSETA
jgi:hypothetical protein